jgi:hypothetical protein
MITYFKIFESINDGIIVYHGGDELTDDNIKNGGIFTTPNKKDAMWFVNNRIEEGAWLTKMIVKIETPLIEKDFNKKWLPMLDEAGIKYTMNNGEFYCPDIIENGGYMEWNTAELFYIKEFVDVALKHGYDGIIGWDVLDNYSIKVYIPFLKKNIKILEKQYFNKPTQLL